MNPCTVGKVNDTQTMVLRDMGSTTCVVKTSLVKPEQMTGSYELCMLIDGVEKGYPTVVVDLDTPYFRGKTKVLCMETPLQDIIIDNVLDVCGTDTGCYKNRVNRCEKHTSTSETKVTHGVVFAKDKVKTGTEADHSRNEIDGSPLEVAAVQTWAMAAKEKLSLKSLKVKTVSGLDTGPEELKDKQRSDRTLKKYEKTCELARNELGKVKTRN